LNPLWMRPTRKSAKRRLRLVSEMLPPRLNLEEKERNVPPANRTRITPKDSPTSIQTAVALVNRPFIQYRTSVNTVLQLFNRGQLSFCMWSYVVSAVSFRKTSSSLASLPASAILRRLSSAPRATMLPLSMMAILVAWSWAISRL